MSEAISWVTDELLVSVRGDDARQWLNGQITNDLKDLSPAHPVYGLVLNTKGRILADALAIDDPNEGLLMALPSSVWPTVSAHLERYIIMEDVTLAPREDLALITVQQLSAPPDAGWFPHARLERGFDAVVPRAEADARLSRLDARVIGEDERERLRVARGRPRFAHDFGESTYPQEAGLVKGAVSFGKGCYLGQEVVCMLETRGQISRRLVRLKGPLGLRIGTELTDAAGTAVGAVTSATDLDGASVGLGMVKRAHIQPGTALAAGTAQVEVVGPAEL